MACSPDAVMTPNTDRGGFAERGIALDLIWQGQTIPFTPLPTSAACVAGGRADQQLVLPPG